MESSSLTCQEVRFEQNDLTLRQRLHEQQWRPCEPFQLPLRGDCGGYKLMRIPVRPITVKLMAEKKMGRRRTPSLFSSDPFSLLLEVALDCVGFQFSLYRLSATAAGRRRLGSDRLDLGNGDLILLLKIGKFHIGFHDVKDQILALHGLGISTASAGYRRVAKRNGAHDAFYQSDELIDLEAAGISKGDND